MHDDSQLLFDILFDGFLLQGHYTKYSVKYCAAKNTARGAR